MRPSAFLLNSLMISALGLAMLAASCTDGKHAVDFTSAPGAASGSPSAAPTTAPGTMAVPGTIPNGPKYTYVLVHGAWAGGWEWKKIDDRLTADGNKVYRPTLTGQGERYHLASPDIDLDTHITDIVNVILFENLHDIVLMGHSYGGMVVTGVADRVPDRIKCVVYVDAFLPEDGESLNSLGNRGGRGAATGPGGGGGRGPATTRNTTTNPATTGRGRGAALQPPPGFQGAPPRAGQQPPYTVPQSIKTFSQPVSLKNPAARKIPTVYILTVDKGQQPEQDTFFRFYTRAKGYGWECWTMEGDHVVNQTHPVELTALLEKAPAAAKPRQ